MNRIVEFIKFLVENVSQLFDFLFNSYQLTEAISIRPIYVFFGIGALIILVVGMLRSIIT